MPEPGTIPAPFQVFVVTFHYPVSRSAPPRTSARWLSYWLCLLGDRVNCSMRSISPGGSHAALPAAFASRLQVHARPSAHHR